MIKRLAFAFVGMVGLHGCFEDAQTDAGNESTSGSMPDSTSTGGSSGGTADTTAGESTGEVDVCPEYCGLIQDVCQDELQQYQSGEICLGVCAALPPGTADDQLGNTAGCRRFQSVQAAESPSSFCGPAGPTGAGVCGAECEAFCGLAMELCTGDMAQWDDVPSCIVDCMQFPNDVPYNSMVVEGDSYACRSYHLTVAALDPVVHCPHIALRSPPCM